MHWSNLCDLGLILCTKEKKGAIQNSNKYLHFGDMFWATKKIIFDALHLYLCKSTIAHSKSTKTPTTLLCKLKLKLNSRYVL